VIQNDDVYRQLNHFSTLNSSARTYSAWQKQNQKLNPKLQREKDKIT
jgi:hypothetical protein